MREVLQYIGIIAAGIALAIALYKLARKGLASAIRSLLRHEYPGREFVKQNKEIYTAIVEMRALVDADRGYVIQFHNGHEFLLSNPVWKLTNTHEVVRPGITYEASNIQSVLASRVSELIEPILLGDFSGDGVFHGSKCETCKFASRCDSGKKWVAVVQVDELPAGFSKFFLENQNIKTVIECGMANKHGAFGLVGVDFCGQPITDEKQLAEICQRVCHTAERVHFALQYKVFPGAGQQTFSQ